MQKITSSRELKYLIEEMENQRDDDLLILKYSIEHIDMQLKSIDMIKYSAYIMLNAWLSAKGKQLISIAFNVFKIMIR